MNVQRTLRTAGNLSVRASYLRIGSGRRFSTASRFSAPDAKGEGEHPSTNPSKANHQLKSKPNPKATKTVAQADAELRERLEQMSGEGGAAGVEYEDGKPSAMKRGVRNNMFRYI